MENTRRKSSHTAVEIVLRVVLVLLPSLLILGVIFRLNHPHAVIPDTIVEASILCETDASGTPESLDASLFKTLDQFFNEGTLLPGGTPADLSDYTAFSWVIRTNGSSGEKRRSYTLYVSPADPDTGTFRAFFATDTASGKAYYEAPEKPLFVLLQTDHLRSCYEDSVFPVLTSSAGDVILPIDGAWRYEDVGGDPHTYSFNDPDAVATYEQTGPIRFSFSEEPTSCQISILTPEGETVFNGSGAELQSALPNRTGTLEVTINAAWGEGRYGLYHFFLNGLAPARFTVDTALAKPGGFILFRAANVTTPSRLLFASTPDLGTSPVFYSAHDGTLLCVLPLSSSLAETDYSIVFSYNGTSHTFRLPISKAGQKEIELSMNASRTLLLKNVHLQKATNDLFLRVCAYDSGNYCLNDGITTAGDLLGISPAYRFSDTLTVGDQSFKANRVFYQCPPGTSVPAVAGGIVTETANDRLLGLCVAVDHGKGIRTWYTHLGDIHVRVGQTVVSGSVLGRVGDTGLTDSVGFGYTATIGDMLIDPETLPDLVRILNE